MITEFVIVICNHIHIIDMLKKKSKGEGYISIIFHRKYATELWSMATCIYRYVNIDIYIIHVTDNMDNSGIL